MIKTLRASYGAALLAGAVSLLAISAAAAESLNTALAKAYNNSNVLAQGYAGLRSSDEDVAIALSRLRPQISGRARATHTDPTPLSDSLNSTVDLSLEMLLFDSNRSRLSVEAAKETVLAVRSSLVQQEQQVLLGAVNAYLGVLRDQQVVALREKTLSLITQELRAAEDRFDVGEVTRTDVAQAQARLAQARGALADARGQLEISKSLYKTAVGVAPGPLQQVTRLPNLPQSLEKAHRKGYSNNALIRQAQHEIKANELNAAASEAAMRPSLSLEGSAGYSEANDTTSSIGLRMDIPIYQGGQLQALRRKALSAVHSSRANLNQVVLQVEQNISDSWSQLSVANAQVKAADRQIKAAQIAYDGVREEAKLGSRTTLDVLDAEQVLFDARTNRVISQSQVYSAGYSVLAAMGHLTADALGLSVNKYDPTEYYNAAKHAPIRRSKQGQKLDRILNRYQKN